MKTNAILVLVMAVTLLLPAARLQEMPVGAITDDALYVELARSLAEGHGHTLNVGPGLAEQDIHLFPPGMAILLSPLTVLFPDPLAALKILPLVAGAILLWLTWLWVPSDQPRSLALVTVLLTAWNPFFVGWSTRILSDIPHAALVLGALLLASRALAEKEEGRRLWLWAGVLAGGAVAVRSVGWTVVISILVVGVAYSRRRVLLNFLGGVLAVLLPVWGLTGARPLEQGYTAQIFTSDRAEFWDRLGQNFVGYLQEWVGLLVPVFGPYTRHWMESRAEWAGGLYLTLLFLVLTVLAGSFFKGRGQMAGKMPGRIRANLALMYVAVSLAVLGNFRGYPSGVQTRLLLPMLPLVVWLVITGVWSNKRRRLGMIGIMLAAALAHNGWRIARPLRTTITADGSGVVNPAEGTDWVRTHTAAGAVIMVRDPVQRHIHWGRDAVGFPAERDSLDSAVSVHHADLVFVAPAVGGQPHQLDRTGRRFLSRLQAQPRRYTPVHADSARALYIFRPNP